MSPSRRRTFPGARMFAISPQCAQMTGRAVVFLCIMGILVVESLVIVSQLKI